MVRRTAHGKASTPILLELLLHKTQVKGLDNWELIYTMKQGGRRTTNATEMPIKRVADYNAESTWRVWKTNVVWFPDVTIHFVQQLLSQSWFECHQSQNIFSLNLIFGPVGNILRPLFPSFNRSCHFIGIIYNFYFACLFTKSQCDVNQFVTSNQ